MSTNICFTKQNLNIKSLGYKKLNKEIGKVENISYKPMILIPISLEPVFEIFEI